MTQNSVPTYALGALAVAGLMIGAASPADSLAAEDRSRGIRHLEHSASEVDRLVKGLTPTQWTFREGPDRWSIAEIVEHLALAEEVLLENARGMMQSPAGAPDRDIRSIDTMVLTVIADRTNKATAAAPTVPTRRWTPAAALSRFHERRDRTIEYLRTAEGLRDHVAASPLGQPMDAYQWLLFLSAHTERHRKQIAEVIAHPRFPE
ncbi:MAG: DinB family protein [Bryobacteraceae bacterium]